MQTGGVADAQANQRVRIFNPSDVFVGATSGADDQRAEAVAAAAPSLKLRDPLFPKQWHLFKIQVPQAWALNVRGTAKVKVCHVSSGAKSDHPDLIGAIEKGWSYVPASQSNPEKYNPAKPGTPEYRNYNDSLGPGTQTAGLIAATSNTIGVAGVAFGVKLLVCRFIWDDGSGWTSPADQPGRLCSEVVSRRARAASRAAADCRRAAPRPSMPPHPGSPKMPSKALKDALLNLERKGRLVVFARGLRLARSASPHLLPPRYIGVEPGADLDVTKEYPASSGHANQINVVSSNKLDRLSRFSAYGNKTVDLVAPGERLWTTVASKATYAEVPGGPGHAAAIVAGAAAALQSRTILKVGRPLPSVQLKKLIVQNVDTVPALKGKVASAGRLNFYKAAQALNKLLSSKGRRALRATA
eukprot:scaffold10.g2402.t1